MSDLAAFAAYFGEPAIVAPFESLAPAPVKHHASVTACVEVMHDAYTREGCSEEECFLRAIEKLRDELGPEVHAPRRAGARVSQKAKRRVVAALDNWIAQGRGA